MVPLRQSVLNVTALCLAVGLLGIVGYLAHALISAPIPPENEAAINMLLGIVSAQFGVVVAFYFGSTVLNKQQAETGAKLADLAKAAQTAALPPPPAVTLDPGEGLRVEAAGNGAAKPPARARRKGGAE